ncbi:MAG: response regulator transcription factor [Chitinophagaceae bacterium]|nr:response regulator transcription factor [Chitinophagaceae bacterium]
MKQAYALNARPIIAVVDDHPLMRKTICQVLESQGLHVELQLANGQELLDTLSRAASIPQICILDIQMSVMNGLDTLKKLRELCPGIKTLVYSFTTNERIIREMMNHGAEDYLFKGCSVDELLFKLQQLLLH